jgi:hypothetical protein
MLRGRSAGIAIIAATVAVLAGCGGGSSGGSDEKTLALGESAVVDFKPTSGSPTKLGVTVTKVRKGTKEQLTAGGLKPDDPDATPYYVDATFENQGQAAVKRNALNLSLEDSDGNSLPTTLIFDFGGKPYALCPNTTDGTLKPGETFDSCSLVLVPKGKDVKTVLFVSQKPNAEIVFTRWAADPITE